MNNDEYWKKFYKNGSLMQPSSFAIFCASIFTRYKHIIDLGCGNKRDSNFFVNKGFNVTSVDPNGLMTLKVNAEHIKYDENTIVYARFFFHAIPKRIENKIINNIIEGGADLYAEFRISESMFDGEKYQSPDNTHYRRLINPKKFVQKLQDNGYQVNYTQSRFSPYKGDNPMLGRIVAYKK